MARSLTDVADLDWAAPLPARRIEPERSVRLDRKQWPATIPAVAQLLDDGMQLGRVTLLVGANGAGKSTIVEAIAMAYGMNGEGGSSGARNSTFASESALHEDLRIVRGPGATRWGYFIRAETMHGLFTYLENNRGGTDDPVFHEMSHGESFLQILDTRRFRRDGFFVMDEPEAGLAFEAQLILLGKLIAMSERNGTQILLATHSPILASLPGATLIELDDDGFRRTTWEDLAVVGDYRRFLTEPDRYLRYLT